MRIELALTLSLEVLTSGVLRWST